MELPIRRKILALAIFAFLASSLCGCASAPPHGDSTEQSPSIEKSDGKVTDETPVETVPADDEIYGPWTVQSFSHEIAGDDPIEPFNRSMFWVNDVGMRYVIRPVGYVWGSIFPRPVIRAFNRFTDNLGFPVRMFSCFFQARFSDGGVEFLRFLSNSTLGIVGFFEVADPWFGLKRKDEDFGQAFASWGCGRSFQIFLPLYGPSNLRDGIGLIFDAAFDPKTYFYGGSAFTGLNRGVSSYYDYEQLRWNSADPYKDFSDLQTIMRELQTKNWIPQPQDMMVLAAIGGDDVGAEDAPEVSGLDPLTGQRDIYSRFTRIAESITPEVEIRQVGDGKFTVHLTEDFNSRSPVIDTIRYVKVAPWRQEYSTWSFLSLWNSDFVGEAYNNTLQFAEGLDPMPYRYWKPQAENRRKDAPLAVIIPGLGGNERSAASAAMAEILNDDGYAVAVIPNTLHSSFFNGAVGRGKIPGYTPDDAATVGRLVDAIVADIAHRYGHYPERLVVCGYSLGGILTLHMAALEDGAMQNAVDRFVAVNAPVDVLYALEQLDMMVEASEELSFAEAKKKANDAVGKFLILNQFKFARWWGGYDRSPDDDYSPLDLAQLTQIFTEDEVKFLIGSSFRMSLQDLIVSIHRRDTLEVLPAHFQWGDRVALNIEADAFDFRDYAYKILFPTIVTGKEGVPTAELERLSELDDFDESDNPLVGEISNNAGLRSIEEILRTDERVRLLHTMDDFLLSEGDRQFLNEAMGSRVSWFEHGSHLGNLYLKSVHREFLRHLMPEKKK